MTISEYLNQSLIFNEPENLIYKSYIENEYGSFDLAYTNINSVDKLWLAFKNKRQYDFKKLEVFYNNNNINIFELDKLGFINNSESNAQAINNNIAAYQGFNVAGDFSNDKATANSNAKNKSQSINYYDELLKMFGSMFNSLFLFIEIFMNDIMIKFYVI